MKVEEVPFLPYWRNETSGRLSEAVVAYFENEPLTVEQIKTIKQYLSIWANYSGWKFGEDQQQQIRELRHFTEVICGREGINSWIEMALPLGIDPF